MLGKKKSGKGTLTVEINEVLDPSQKQRIEQQLSGANPNWVGNNQIQISMPIDGPMQELLAQATSIEGFSQIKLETTLGTFTMDAGSKGFKSDRQSYPGADQTETKPATSQRQHVEPRD